MITETDAQMLPLEVLFTNDGQIEGLPANPRTITKAAFAKLKASIKENNLTGVMPLKVLPHGDGYVVLGGNMRLRALRELGAEQVSCIIVPEDTDLDSLQQIVIEDNSQFGEWDMDLLANDWDEDKLRGWGVDVPVGIDTDRLIEQASSSEATREYSEDTNYDLSELWRSRVNPDITKAIDEGVKNGQIRPEIERVLRCRAEQCSIFNFDQLCKFYRSADPTQTERELLRRLYLVFVAPKELFEIGMLKVRQVANEIFDDELLTKHDDDDDFTEAD